MEKKLTGESNKPEPIERTNMPNIFVLGEFINTLPVAEHEVLTNSRNSISETDNYTY
jgi:hypothetical protein